MKPEIKSVDASGNVALVVTTTTTVDILTAERDAAQGTLSSSLQDVINASNYLTKMQAAHDAAQITFDAKQALLDAAKPLQDKAVAALPPEPPPAPRPLQEIPRDQPGGGP